MTNADKIRAMSDTEIAFFLWMNDWIYLKTPKEIIEWLQQGA